MAHPQKYLFFPATSLHNNANQAPKQQVRLLYIIILLSLLAKTVLCFFVLKQHVQRDTLDYFEQADILLAGGYKNYFPNGYPFLIAASKAIAGQYYIGMLLWINILMSCIAVYFIYAIAQALTGNGRTALLAAVLLAFFPTQLNYVRWILSEVPSTFFLIGFFFFYIRQQWLLSGLFIACATLIRTEFGIVLPIILFYELVFLKKIRTALMFSFFLPLFLVGFYCYQKTGKFSLSGHGKVNILYSITASGSYVDWMYEDKHPEIKTSAQAMDMYIDRIKKDPAGYIKSRAANYWELWGFFPSSSDGNRKLPARIMIGCINFFLLVFGLLGWWKYRKNYYAAILLIPFCIITMVHTLLVALPRYTYAAEPFMILFAGIFLFSKLPQLRTQNKK